EISSRLMAVLANEGALIVEEGIAQDFSNIDIVQISGYGFPRWRGGPMQYANETGWDKTAKMMKAIADENPGSWRLAALDK
ncbi:MAG: enoyl-CoA hydratase, partial [Proteobacteria bacterium]|nr:enoyl-CoA hydratase [Pseudomonadota bacterium]